MPELLQPVPRDLSAFGEVEGSEVVTAHIQPTESPVLRQIQLREGIVLAGDQPNRGIAGKVQLREGIRSAVEIFQACRASEVQVGQKIVTRVKVTQLRGAGKVEA